MAFPLNPNGYGKNHKLPQIIAILSGSLVWMGQGMLFSWTSPAIPQLTADNSTYVSLEEASYFTVIYTTSMAVTAPLFSLLIDIIGRKKVVLLIAVLQLIAWILTGYAKSIWVFYTARAFAGVGDAAMFAASAIYVCEISEVEVRTTWGNTITICMYIGICLINIIGTYVDIMTTALICGSIPIFHIAFFSFMPESPYYLLMKGQDDKARKSLKLLRWRNDIDDELTSLRADVQRQLSESGTLREMFTVDSNWRAVLMCFITRSSQQLSGLAAFETYTQYLFQQAGGSISHTTSSIIFSGNLALCVVLAPIIINRFGRRPLMTSSCFGCGVVLSIETIYFAIVEFTDLDVSDFGWVPLAGMLGFILLLSIGVGILPTIIAGEVFSASIKSKAIAIMNIVLAGYMMIIPKLFQSLTYNFGLFAPFCFFSLCCFINGGLSYYYVIETKGRTLEEIQQVLKGNKFGGKKLNNLVKVL